MCLRKSCLPSNKFWELISNIEKKFFSGNINHAPYHPILSTNIYGAPTINIQGTISGATVQDTTVVSLTEKTQEATETRGCSGAVLAGEKRSILWGHLSHLSSTKLP